MKIKKIFNWIIYLIIPFCGYLFFNNFFSSSDEFDFLVFAQSWPRATCSKWKKESPENTCLLPGHDEWTVHGIWPTFINESGPNYCKSPVKFDLTAVASIEDQLMAKWTNIHNKTNAKYFEFWKHEWDKHGTCSVNHPLLNSVIKYFQTGLDLADEYDIKKILTFAKIVPGKSYSVQKIVDKLFDILGKQSRVTCFWDKEEEKSYLLEVSICLDKDLNLINCDDVGVGQVSNCKSQFPVFYIGQE